MRHVSFPLPSTQASGQLLSILLKEQVSTLNPGFFLNLANLTRHPRRSPKTT